MIISLTIDYNLSLELRRIELRTSRMQSEHSTAELQPLGIYFVYLGANFYYFVK